MESLIWAANIYAIIILWVTGLGLLGIAIHNELANRDIMTRETTK